jgi:alpha-beta hydrolase superfamily lysophospholipase
MPSTTTMVAARDGVPLLVRYWPPSGRPWMHALVIHGLEDHSGRYRRLGDQYATNGIAVHSFDQRWSGGSGGRPGDIDSWDQLLDDLEDRLAAVRAIVDGAPLLLHGHLLGGLLVADYLGSGRPLPDLAVLTAPGLDDDLPRWKHAAAPVLARLVPGLRLANGIDPVSLAHDLGDPALFGPDDGRVAISTVRFASLGFAAQERVRQAVSGLERAPIPLLVLHGTGDTLVPPRASEPFEKLAGARRIVYPELRHELHNEPEGPAVIADIVGWLRERARGASATAM